MTKDCIEGGLFGDECTCSCHKTGGMHIRACCAPCPDCHKNISIGREEKHSKRCRPRAIDLPMVGKLLKCSKCYRLILVVDEVIGVSHTVSTVVPCWDCLNKKLKTKVAKLYNIKL